MSAEGDHLALAFPQKPVAFVRGAGAHLYAEDGRRFVDLGGASHGTAAFGHAHPRIVAAVGAQAQRLIHTVPTVGSPMRAAFLGRLHALLPPHLERTFLANSGAEAVEAALKYAMAATGRTRFVAARGGFHGRTLGALSVTHKPQYRQPFEGVLGPVDFVPYNDPEALAAAVTRETAAVILEPIQGEGGVVPAAPGTLAAAKAAAHAHGALLILDEIQTGLGRTGRTFAMEAHDVAPDIVLLGKALAGGLPIGAAAMTRTVAHAMPGGGHGGTFGGSPLVMAAAAEALDVLRDENLAAQAAVKGRRLMAGLRGLGSPLVREVRGEGLMVGLELRVRSQPVLTRLLEAGFLALPGGATTVRLLPPLVIAPQDLDAAVDALGAALPDPVVAGAGEAAR